MALSCTRPLQSSREPPYLNQIWPVLQKLQTEACERYCMHQQPHANEEAANTAALPEMERAASGSAQAKKPILDRILDWFPGPLQFIFLSICVFIFFGCHNFLQEAISRMPDFVGLGSILGYLEVVGVMVCSYFERASVGDSERHVPIFSYAQLTACLLGSSYLSTVGLNYINYPTKVVFRSCKLIPTMAVAYFVYRERFSLVQNISAVAIVCGLIFFSYADMTADTKVSTPFGMTLQAASVVCDAFLPNLQAALFKAGASRLEVTYYTNLYVFFIMTLLGGGSGHIVGAYNFVKKDTAGGVYLLCYTIVAYVAISFHMKVVEKFGSVVAVLVGNARKAGTITLSFLVFPKPFSMLYVYGTVLVLGGLTATAYDKERKKRMKSNAEKEEQREVLLQDSEARDSEKGERAHLHARSPLGPQPATGGGHVPVSKI